MTQSSLEVEQPDDRLLTFKNSFARSCDCLGPRYARFEDVIAYATKTSPKCSTCGAAVQLGHSIGHFNTLGYPEQLLGLDVYVINKPVPATEDPQVMVIDLSTELPAGASIVYANVNPECFDWDEAPALLGPYNSASPWPSHMRFYIPRGGERSVTVLFAVKPAGVQHPPLELALQAVEVFHRQNYPLAGLLLGASFEASLRPLCEAAYRNRSTNLGQPGFGQLLDIARVFFEPVLGSHLVGNLKSLAREARNPTAHGAETAELSRERVARWMVDVAVLFEWSRMASTALELRDATHRRL